MDHYKNYMESQYHQNWIEPISIFLGHQYDPVTIYSLETDMLKNGAPYSTLCRFLIQTVNNLIPSDEPNKKYILQETKRFYQYDEKYKNMIVPCLEKSIIAVLEYHVDRSLEQYEQEQKDKYS